MLASPHLTLLLSMMGRRLSYGGANEKKRGLLLGVRSGRAGRARKLAAHANASAGELLAGGANQAGKRRSTVIQLLSVCERFWFSEIRELDASKDIVSKGNIQRARTAAR